MEMTQEFISSLHCRNVLREGTSIITAIEFCIYVEIEVANFNSGCIVGSILKHISPNDNL